MYTTLSCPVERNSTWDRISLKFYLNRQKPTFFWLLFPEINFVLDSAIIKMNHISYNLSFTFFANQISIPSSQLLFYTFNSMVQVTNWITRFGSIDELCPRRQKIGSRETMFNRMERYVKLFSLFSHFPPNLFYHWIILSLVIYYSIIIWTFKFNSRFHLSWLYYILMSADTFDLNITYVLKRVRERWT